MRDTKTKGIWVWGTPIEVDIDGSKVSVLYLDTEGFESVGKSNVYDDRTRVPAEFKHINKRRKIN